MNDPRCWIPTVLALVLAATFPAATGAQQQTPTDQTPTAVRYLQTEAWLGGEQLVVRAALELTSPAHRSYTVYFHLAQDNNEYLRIPGRRQGGEPWIERWGRLFMPENPRTLRWTQLRIGFTREAIGKAVNLPRGARTRLWAVFNVYDDGARRYLGNGWEKRAMLFVTTDAEGRVTRIEAPERAGDLAGMWTFHFPDGRTYGVCNFSPAAQGQWAWSIYAGGGRSRATSSQGAYTLAANQLTLRHRNGPVQIFTLRWIGEREFTLTLGQSTLRFKR